MPTNFVVRVNADSIRFQSVALLEQVDQDAIASNEVLALDGTDCNMVLSDEFMSFSYDIRSNQFVLNTPVWGSLPRSQFEAAKKSISLIARNEERIRQFANLRSGDIDLLLRALFRELRVVGGSYEFEDNKGSFGYSRSKTEPAQITNLRTIIMLADNLSKHGPAERPPATSIARNTQTPESTEGKVIN